MKIKLLRDQTPWLLQMSFREQGDKAGKGPEKDRRVLLREVVSQVRARLGVREEGLESANGRAYVLQWLLSTEG